MNNKNQRKQLGFNEINYTDMHIKGEQSSYDLDFSNENDNTSLGKYFKEN